MMVRAPLSVSVSRMALRLGSGLQPEHAGATHAVQRLDDHVLVLVVEGFQTGHVAGHQRGRGELADFGDGQLFRVIADGRAGVEDLGALLLGVFQQMGGIHVFHVEGRILAHDDRAQIGQAHIPGLGFAPPVMAVQVRPVDQLDGRGHGADGAFLDIQVALHGHAERMPARDQRAHHGDRTVLVRLQERQGIQNEQNVHRDTLNGRRLPSREGGLIATS